MTTTCLSTKTHQNINKDSSEYQHKYERICPEFYDTLENTVTEEQKIATFKKLFRQSSYLKKHSINPANETLYVLQQLNEKWFDTSKYL